MDPAIAPESLGPPPLIDLTDPAQVDAAVELAPAGDFSFPGWDIGGLVLADDGSTAYAVVTAQTSDVWRCLIPILPGVVAALLVLTWVGVLAWLWRRRVRQHHDAARLGFTVYCRACGYPLTGSTSPTCPECGLAFGPHDIVPWPRRPWRTRVIAVTTVAILLLAAWLALLDNPDRLHRWRPGWHSHAAYRFADARGWRWLKRFRGPGESLLVEIDLTSGRATPLDPPGKPSASGWSLQWHGPTGRLITEVRVSPPPAPVSQRPIQPHPSWHQVQMPTTQIVAFDPQRRAWDPLTLPNTPSHVSPTSTATGLWFLNPEGTHFQFNSFGTQVLSVIQAGGTGATPTVRTLARYDDRVGLQRMSRMLPVLRSAGGFWRYRSSDETLIALELIPVDPSLDWEPPDLSMSMGWIDNSTDRFAVHLVNTDLTTGQRTRLAVLSQPTVGSVGLFSTSADLVLAGEMVDPDRMSSPASVDLNVFETANPDTPLLRVRTYEPRHSNSLWIELEGTPTTPSLLLPFAQLTRHRQAALWVAASPGDEAPRLWRLVPPPRAVIDLFGQTEMSADGQVVAGLMDGGTEALRLLVYRLPPRR